MKRLLTILLIALLSGLATWFFPWWMIALVPYLVVVILQTPKPFWVGFFGIALLWLVWILAADIPNDHILSIRMTKLFSMPNYQLLILVNVLLGGLIGGLAAYSAGRMNKAFRRQR